MRIRGVMWWFLEKLFKSESPADKFITVNKQAKLLHKKEQEIYKQTMKFEKKNPLVASFDYLLYDFQIFCEFIEKYKDELELKYDWDMFELLNYFSLVLRFLRIWYYESSWIYVRKAFEYWLNMFYSGKKSVWTRKKIQFIIDKKKAKGWPMMFDVDEVYKIYSYLSDKFTHFNWNTVNIKFDKRKIFEMDSVFVITIITISNMTVNLIDDGILLKYWKNKIDNPVEEYIYYANYIWPLVWSWFISGCQYWFKNACAFYELWKSLDLEKWIKDFDEK